MSELIINNRLINAPIINIIKQLKSELDNGKLKDVQIKGENVRVTCPSHKDGQESHPSCGIYMGDSDNIEYGTFHCFTCGAGGPLYHFVAECFEQDDEFGKDWLVERFGNTIIEKELILKPIELTKTTSITKMDESFLDNLQSYHPYLEKRKISRDVCSKFKVKYEPSSQCVVFPVWDERGNLCMTTKRSVNSKNFYIDADKKKPVYLLNFIKEHNIQEVTVVESQFNCLTLWGWGIPSVALFGTGDGYQYDILNKSGIRHYYLCLDGDNAGDKGITRFLKNIRDDVFVDIILMERGKDVNDLSEEQFNALKIISKEEWLNEHRL